MTAAKARHLEQTAHVLLGNSHAYEAREICQLVCQSKFATAESYSILASTFLTGFGDEGKAQLAKKYLEKALQLDAKSSSAYNILALLANEEGRFDDTIKYANLAIANPPIPIQAYQSKASALANLNRNSEALTVINKAQALDNPATNPGILWVKGNILENLKSYKEAADCYEKSLKLYDTDWVYFRLVHCLEMQNKIAQAIAVTNKIIIRNSKDGEAYRTRALLKVKSQDLAGAVKDYDACLSLEPTAKTYRDRAQLHLKLGHKELFQRDQGEAQKIESRPF
ncbi:hypothetical protein BH11CYA1_BH11CYA1_17360 [soil metagenome]